jgi:hypothetical protein
MDKPFLLIILNCILELKDVGMSFSFLNSITLKDHLCFLKAWLNWFEMLLQFIFNTSPQNVVIISLVVMTSTLFALKVS